MFASFILAAIVLWLVLTILRGAREIILIAFILWGLSKAGLF
jgi:hypothetical protein